MANEIDPSGNSPRFSDHGKKFLLLAIVLPILLIFPILVDGNLGADEDHCLFGCLRVIDEESSPVEEYAVTVVDETDPFPDVFTFPPGFPPPPRGTVVRSHIVRSPDGAHEISSPVGSGHRIDVFAAGHLMSSVPPPRPGETVVIRLSRAFALRGRVENSDGRPVEGAEIRLHGSEVSVESPRSAMAMTDGEGHFEIAPLYRRQLLLEIVHPGFRNLRSWIDISQPPERQTFRVGAPDERTTLPLPSSSPVVTSLPPPDEEAQARPEVDPVPLIQPHLIYVSSLPVPAPESTLSDLDRSILREVFRDVRRRVQDVMDEWEDPVPWELLVLARTEPFDWMEEMSWAIDQERFDAKPLLRIHDVERSGVPVSIDRVVRETGLEPVTLFDLPLEKHPSSFPIAIDFVDHSRHREQIGRLPVLVSATLPAMNDSRTEAIVFIRSSVFDFFQWVYHVKIQNGRPTITWVAEPVPSC